MKGIPATTRVVLAAMGAVLVLIGLVIGYRIGAGAFPRPDSSALSAGSALLALLFSLFVWFQTRSLQRPTERPIVAVTAFGLRREKDDPKGQIILTLEAKNAGNHPAIDLRTQVGYAPQNAPQRFEAVYDDELANPVEPQNPILWQEAFGQYLSVDAFIYVLFSYRDSLTQKRFHNEFWARYPVTEGRIFHAFKHERERLLPYVRNVYPLDED